MLNRGLLNYSTIKFSFVRVYQNSDILVIFATNRISTVGAIQKTIFTLRPIHHIKILISKDQIEYFEFDVFDGMTLHVTKNK